MSKTLGKPGFFKDLSVSFFAALLATFLTWPILSVKTDHAKGTIVYYWDLLIYVAVVTFLACFLGRFFLDRHRKKNISLWLLDTKSGQIFWRALRGFLCVLAAGLLFLYVQAKFGAGLMTDVDNFLIKLGIDKLPFLFKLSLLALAAASLFMLYQLPLSLKKERRRTELAREDPDEYKGPEKSWIDLWFSSKYRNPSLITFLLFLASIPFWGSSYMLGVLVTALVYITLGLGLNIVVGVSGLLNLGYVAFYAIGAYTYALLNHYFGWGFWICLPIGAFMSTLFGLLLGIPVLRLRGDYLAIVTLGFGEIVRQVLLNFGELTNGPAGIDKIGKPVFFGVNFDDLTNYFSFLYYLMILIVIFTIIMVYRLENSRLGRAWLAMREDEVACQAMGIDRTKAKLTAFALGATWAGLAGVVFAAKTTFINPDSFTFMESVMILSVVVLGGMGSLPGVIIGALVLTLLPEYLRAVSDYRMLLFGLLMVIMMVFRPGGLIQSVRQTYIYKPEKPALETPQGVQDK